MSSQVEAITKRVDTIEQKVVDRLPEQRKILWAKLCTWKWMMKTIYKPLKLQQDTSDLVDKLSHKIKRTTLEAGQHWYHSAEQGELLTKCLCELDNVLSDGNEEIRGKRKAQVIRIQQLLAIVDIMKEQGELLKSTAKEWFSPYSDILHQVASSAVASDTDEMEQEDPTDDHDDCMNDHEQEVDNPQEDDVMEESDNEEEDMDEENSTQKKIDQLPIWEPRCTVTQDSRAVYIRAFLNGVDESNYVIECDAKTGRIQISGYKLPTEHDLHLSAFSGVPTYGRFIIEETLPTDLVDFDEARYQLSNDQVLEICVPRAYRQRRSFSRPSGGYYQQPNSWPSRSSYYYEPQSSWPRRRSSYNQYPFGLVF